jgi:hypothetical protein
MTEYQRKSLQLIVAINFITGLYQYFSNGVVVFPTQINTLFFLLLALYLGLKAFKKATFYGRILLFIMIIASAVRLFTDPLTLEIIFAEQHEYAMDLVNSSLWAIIQGSTALLLILTLPIMAFMEKHRPKRLLATFAVFTLTLLALAFLDLPFEPLIALFALGVFLSYYLIQFKEDLPQGLSSTMALWLVFILLEATNFWNLHL